MPFTRTRAFTVIVASGIAVLAAAMAAVPLLRPPQGYRAAAAGWLAPKSDVVDIDTIIQRKADFIVDYYGFRYRGNTSNFIDAHVYYYGAFEKPEIYFIRDALQKMPSGPVFVDVGANTGLYTAFASKYAATVHSFEPFPPVLQRLNTIVEENRIANVVVHPVGLGAAAAQLPFFSPPDGNLGTGSFLSGFKEFQPGNRNDNMTLQIVAGDGYFEGAGITRVDLMKIDIEGYEKAAVAGLRETLRRQRPVVVMETSVDPAVDGLYRSLDEIKAAFPENYEFVQINHENNLTGAYRLGPIQSTFDRQDQFNLVAWPTEKASLVPRQSTGN